MGRLRLIVTTTTTVLLIALMAQDQVIAAPNPIDHMPAQDATVQAITEPATTPIESGGLTVWDVLVLSVAAAVLIAFFRTRSHRLRDAPRRSTAVTPLVAALMFIGFLILGRGAVMIAVAALDIDPATATDGSGLTLAEQTQLTLAMYAGQSLILALLIWLTLLHRRAFRKPPQVMGRSVLFGAVTVVMAWPVVSAAAILSSLALWLIRGEVAGNIAHQTLRLLMDNPVDGWFVMLVLLVLCVAPVMEEVMYRGLLQTALIHSNVSRWTAIIVTSTAFALMHGGAADPHVIPALGAFSIALGWAYEKTGSLVAPITMHAMFNAGNLALAMLVAP